MQEVSQNLIIVVNLDTSSLEALLIALDFAIVKTHEKNFVRHRDEAFFNVSPSTSLLTEEDMNASNLEPLYYILTDFKTQHLDNSQKEAKPIILVICKSVFICR